MSIYTKEQTSPTPYAPGQNFPTPWDSSVNGGSLMNDANFTMNSAQLIMNGITSFFSTIWHLTAPHGTPWGPGDSYYELQDNGGSYLTQDGSFYLIN